jgi:hypothetical protein
MKKAAVLAFLATLVAGNVSAADAAGRWARGYGYHHAPHHVWRGRTVYSYSRGPRFVPPPAVPEPFFFEFFPTNRVNTHMY